MSRADHYPPVGDDGRPLMDGGGAADFYDISRGRFRLTAAQNGIQPNCYRHRRAYYTAADVSRIVSIIWGVSVADIEAEGSGFIRCACGFLGYGQDEYDEHLPETA